MSTKGPYERTLAAPFTRDEVIALNAWQRSPNVHPYTHSHPHGTITMVATTMGFLCPSCDAVQDWCYDDVFGRDPLGRVIPSPMVAVDIMERLDGR